MRKYVLLLSSSLMVIFAIVQLISAYVPKTGPVGNGLNGKLVWFQFTCTFIGGASYLVLAIYWIVKEKRAKKAAKSEGTCNGRE